MICQSSNLSALGFLCLQARVQALPAKTTRLAKTWRMEDINVTAERATKVHNAKRVSNAIILLLSPLSLLLQLFSPPTYTIICIRFVNQRRN